jgi:hypothetical protein
MRAIRACRSQAVFGIDRIPPVANATQHVRGSQVIPPELVRPPLLAVRMRDLYLINRLIKIDP